MRFFLFSFISLFILGTLGQLTPPEMYEVNLSTLNLSTTAIAQSNATIYTGYTSINPGNSSVIPPKRQLGFVYVKASGNNTNVAIIPIGGLGPGYSSLEVFLNEFGPYIFPEDVQTNEELQYKPYGLQLNPYALSYQSNLLFIDALPTVGMSYWSGATAGSAKNNNDAQQVTDIYSVVTDIVTSTGYTNLKNATFHIIGNGYAAKLAPLLAQKFANDQTLKLKLAGIFIGNPIFQNYPYSTTDANTRWLNMMNFLNNHNIIGDAEYQALLQCTKNTNDPVCQWGQQTLMQQTRNLNPQDIFRYCYKDNLVPQMYNCTANYGLNNLLTDTTITQALHFMKTASITDIFNYNILSNYNYDYSDNSIQILKNLINQKKYKIWFYSGDASAYMSQVDTVYYLEKVLNLYITQEAKLFQLIFAKPLGNQVGGFQTEYNNGVTFATLKKSGLLAGKWEGYELSTLFQLYLAKAQPSN